MTDPTWDPDKDRDPMDRLVDLLRDAMPKLPDAGALGTAFPWPPPAGRPLADLDRLVAIATALIRVGAVDRVADLAAAAGRDPTGVWAAGIAMRAATLLELLEVHARDHRLRNTRRELGDPLERALEERDPAAPADPLGVGLAAHGPDLERRDYVVNLPNRRSGARYRCAGCGMEIPVGGAFPTLDCPNPPAVAGPGAAKLSDPDRRWHLFVRQGNPPGGAL